MNTSNPMDTRAVNNTGDRVMDVAIISTGGTFGMQSSSRGLTPAPVADRIDVLLRASPIPGLAYSVSELAPQIDSANATPAAWQQIVEAIEAVYDRFDGFVIVHGTDTMAYSAAAVSYAFAGRGKPIVFTGAQRPLSADDSDGPANLLGALEHVILGQSSGVDIFFGGTVLTGSRATKFSTTADRAFIQTPHVCPPVPVGVVGAEGLPFARFGDVEVPVIRMYPGITARVVAAILDGEVPGAVLQCYGFGNVPAAAPGLLEVIARAFDRGQVIVAVTQCVDGEITLGASEVSTSLAEAGVVDGGDMTTEAALTKLHYLFGCGLASGRARELMGVNLVGELARNR
jgi:L-asparaginase